MWKVSPSGIGKVPLVDFNEGETGVKCVDINPRGDMAVSGDDDGTYKVT